MMDIYAYPPLVMRRDEASRFVGVSATKFSHMVEEGRMPQPCRIDRMTLWRTDDLRDALERLLCTEDAGDGPNEWDETR